MMQRELARVEAAVDDQTDELKPGTPLLHGQYVIEAYLNSGGFGMTYLARDSLHRQVVIKECFPTAFCKRSETIVRVRSRAHRSEFHSIVKLFVQEARNLAKLKHPNIVGVHQVFEDNDTAYMALDYVEGRDLLEIAENGEVPEPRQVTELLKKLLDAVHFVHAAGVLHRDISPDNILVDADWNPVLIDFGAARETAARVSRILTSMRVVKDGYSPQEFYLSGTEQYPCSDLYALAASIYHVLSGDIPPNSQERLAAIAGNHPDPYRPLGTRVRGYDEAFTGAIDQALKIFPKDRLQSARAWLDILEGAEARKRTVRTPRPTRVEAKVGQTIRVSHAIPKADGPTPVPARRDRVTPKKPTVAARDVDPVAKLKPTTAPTPSRRPVATRIAAATVLALAAGVLYADHRGFEIPAAFGLTVALPSPLPADPVGETTDGGPEAAFVDGSQSEPAMVDMAFVGGDLAPAWIPPRLLPVMPDAAPEIDTAAPTFMSADDTGGPILRSGLAADLPFSLDGEGRVNSVTTADGPEWLSVGREIAAVNGMPVLSNADVQQALRASGLFIGQPVSATIELAGVAAPVEAQFDTVVETVLRNGDSFVSRLSDGSWITVVTQSGREAANSLKIGDTLVALMPSSEAVSRPDSLARMIRREIAAGRRDFDFVVKRDGSMHLASLQYSVNLQDL